MPHEDCVNFIKRSGDTLALKVVTANIPSIINSHNDSPSHNNGSQSLPYRRKGKFRFFFIPTKKKTIKFISAPLRPNLEKSFGGMSIYIFHNNSVNVTLRTWELFVTKLIA
jgi:hypothetical protein